jgi:hypothetical protein
MCTANHIHSLVREGALREETPKRDPASSRTGLLAVSGKLNFEIRISQLVGELSFFSNVSIVAFL